MKTIVKCFLITLTSLFIFSSAYCSESDQNQIKKIGGLDWPISNIMQLHYSPQEDVYYFLGWRGGYAINQDGDFELNPLYPELNRPPYFRTAISITPKNAIAIESYEHSDPEIDGYYYNDFKNILQKIPYSWISQMKVHDDLICISSYDDPCEFILGNTTEFITGKAARYPIPCLNIWSFEIIDSDHLLLMVEQPNSAFSLIFYSLEQGESLSSIPLREETKLFFGMKLFNDQITTFTMTSAEEFFLDQYDFEGNHVNSINLGTSRVIPVQTADSRILFWKATYDENNKRSGYDFMELISQNEMKPSSSKSRPLIQERDRNELTMAYYLKGDFGLFHPSAHDPKNENARDQSIILAPVRSTNTEMTLDIPYYDLQNTFGSEAKTLLLEWNDQTLSIPLETLDCSETISRITCNAEMTLRLHLSMKEDQIHLNSKELLTTESVDTCTTCIHHIQLP